MIDILYYVGIAVALYAQCSFIYSYKDYITLSRNEDDKLFFSFFMFAMVSLVTVMSIFSWLTVASVYGVRYVFKKGNESKNKNNNDKTLLMD